ncbi:MAG: hypothetical protein J7L15_05585, partial [Clostridiales bacterium]|nr:hypothetical protein [Clostridiales bacterium]
LMLDTDLGLNPWGIFHSGISNLTGVTFGQASQLTGLGIVSISALFKIYPGIGTILNMFFVGYFVDLIKIMHLNPKFSGLPVNIFVFFIGLIIFDFGVYVYLKADLGSGPRDSLMLALTKMTRFTAGQNKIMMEITAAITGYLMGGLAGPGTIIAAIFGGIFLDIIFKLFKYDPKTKTLTNVVLNYQEIKAILQENQQT